MSTIYILYILYPRELRSSDSAGRWSDRLLLLANIVVAAVVVVISRSYS